MQRTQIKKYIASPLNYIGGKARILDQILPLLPSNISTFVDLFCGGCNVGMNVIANNTIYNDISKPLISLLKTFRKMKNSTIINGINSIIDEYGFSRTREHNFKFYGGDANKGVSEYNRKKFLLLRDYFNSYPKKNNKYYILLYTLILFGFNNQLRFNSKGEFNLPVGKRDFNVAIENKLVKFLDALRSQNCCFMNKDFRQFDFEEFVPFLVENPGLQLV
ncbi:DNA adenine methylase [Fibrobacter sp. UWP2]|uniref:DNA adenine methylase n=1 Tax=Fibrobacter sp. UWP2 TaxID=1896216 RepID=UPI000920330F|nr:DNA adenine methylase [Fibrobacter sp. UWP2]SHJ55761.1 D12 class N6 adenine-specific DNA methyltransferase [Fibrobacter sp. UWP2]